MKFLMWKNSNKRLLSLEIDLDFVLFWGYWSLKMNFKNFKALVMFKNESKLNLVSGLQLKTQMSFFWLVHINMKWGLGSGYHLDPLCVWGLWFFSPGFCPSCRLLMSFVSPLVFGLGMAAVAQVDTARGGLFPGTFTVVLSRSISLPWTFCM